MNLKKKVEGIIPEMLFNNVLVTKHQVERTSDIILTTDDGITDVLQEVVKAGPGATYGGNPQVPIEVGDIVAIDMVRFAKRKTSNSLRDDVDLTKEFHQIELPTVIFRNKEYIPITDRDIVYYWKLDKKV